MFKKVDPKQSLPKLEEEILAFWEENKIFEKSLRRGLTRTKRGTELKDFVFYEGPPTANGTPGLHHILARAFKDIIPRYKTMKGFRVERKAGWDTHGLPVEIQVEKDLGIHEKSEIENIVPGNPKESIKKFNDLCKKSVWKYKDEWEKLTERMAYWVDMKNPYVTYENRYIESVWWIFAQIFRAKNKKGESLVYQSHKVVPYCYRCGTTLSTHEVAQGYQTVKDNSVYAKFKVKNEKNTYLLTWTTTPWTLPGNVALAVGKNIDYVRIKINDEILILAKNFLSKIGDGYEILNELKGNDLLGIEYKHLYNTNDTDKKAYVVITGEFVSTEEGTGIVHIAPAFGADDAEVARENNLPTLVTVDKRGIISADVPGKGIPVKKPAEGGSASGGKDSKRYEADNLIIEDLKKRGLLFKEEVYEHEYPYCWRCDTPLIYYAKPSWFIRMSELREQLYENGKNINWIPGYIKEGRFGEWIKDAKDWAISRERYWGTPLPIWICKKCGESKVIESMAELEDLSGKKPEDLHRPFIDDAIFKCDKCAGEMKRIPEVMDVWFDSGSMPLAQFFYPNGASKEDKEKIESGKYFPADYISEAIDQTRGWFYTLHAIATLLKFSGKVKDGYAYRNVICLGHILDAKGKKMSKSRGNVVDPMNVMDKFGADVLRWHLFTINQPGLYKRFDLKNLEEVRNRVFRMLWNSYYFFVMYANIDRFEAKSQKPKAKSNLLDKWIISELNVLIKEADGKLKKYDIYGAASDMEKFIDNLSNWYIRRSRRRFWKSENDEDKNQAYQTLYTVLVELSKLLAPFTPFIAEEIYRNLTGEESVHLADFPVANKDLIDEKLNSDMEKARLYVSAGLQLRADAKIKVRQPLYELYVKEELNKELFDIIGEEVNVKKVLVDKNIDLAKLNIHIDNDLELEGIAREIIRHVQEMRKEAGYEVDNRIKVSYTGASEVFDKFKEIIAKEILAEELITEEIKDADLEKEFNIEGEKIKIQIKK